MSHFSYEECAMLGQLGYAPGFLDDVEEGDTIAFRVPSWMSPDDPGFRFWKISKLRRVPRQGQPYGCLVQFVGTDEAGVAMPCAYGSEWACFILQPVATTEPS